jgi:hypothetical protein
MIEHNIGESYENPYHKKYYGFLKGIVTQNNDPEMRGRVKIAIPEFIIHYLRSAGLDPDVYAGRFVGGENINTIFDAKTLEELNKNLKWAEQASPLIGGGTAGVFDAKNKIATVGEGYTGSGFREPLGDDGITPSGESIAPKASISQHGIEGGHGVGSKTGLCDPYNQTYSPDAINNASKGMFSVPRVGSQVWVFFDQGSPEHPVYMAYVYDKSDWNSVMNPQGSNPNLHYPAGAENVQDSEPYYLTGQTVLNNKSGSLQFTETDGFEKIKMSHFSGSFYEMNNKHIAEASTGNKTSIIQGDKFTTVNGDHAEVIKGDTYITYRGDVHIIYGDLENKTLYEEWRKVTEPAFAHSAQFATPIVPIPDPTLTGIIKKNVNQNFKFPANRLTNNIKALGSKLMVIPNKLMKIVPHDFLGIKLF